MDLFVGLVAVTCVAAATVAAELHPLSDAFINRINSEQDSWIAGRNFPEDTPLKYLKRLNGAPRYDEAKFEKLPRVKHSADMLASLPESFDPREKWTNCSSLHEIRDEGSCWGSWAVAAASVITDRICIYSKGNKQFHASAEDFVTCASDYGNCNYAWSIGAWMYWKSDGVVSGGNYNSSQGCVPYSTPACIHYASAKDGLESCTDKMMPTPKCTKQCRSGYNVTYENDKQRPKRIYQLDSKEENIMAELCTYGPVQASIDVYEDFLSYKEGVYYHHSGRFMAALALKLMGWGIEKGQKYWLLAHSWNEHWGDQGYVKMLRGTNECGVEEFITTGEPLII